jgi:hypothetical protein
MISHPSPPQHYNFQFLIVSNKDTTDARTRGVRDTTAPKISNITPLRISLFIGAAFAETELR